jgi:hypothetical protein
MAIGPVFDILFSPYLTAAHTTVRLDEMQDSVQGIDRTLE